MKTRNILLAALFCASTLFAGTSTRNTLARDTILDGAVTNGATASLGITTINGKLSVTNEIHATVVLEAGLSGTSPGMLSLINQETNAWVNLTASNGVFKVGTDKIALNALCELSFKQDDTQDFTGSAGFEVVTNLEDNVVDVGFTTTSSNITIAVTGRYFISSPGMAFETATASQVEMMVYTNGVLLLDTGGNDIGWKRTQSNATSDGVTAFGRTVTLAAGTVVDLRVDVGADETATWDSGSFMIEKK